MIHTSILLREQAPAESFYAAFTALDRAAEDSRRVGYVCQLLQHLTVKEFSDVAIRDLEEGMPLSLAQACRRLCDALAEAGWLDCAKDREPARMALRLALKETPDRQTEAITGLDRFLA